MIYLPSHHASSDPLSEDIPYYSPPNPSANPRDVLYDSARLEKTARAEEFSAIKRAVSKTAIVIADAPNYIKGFRYQLHCEAKSAGTRSVVVHCAAREDECRIWNDARLRAWGLPTSESTEADTPDATFTAGPKIGRDVLGELEPESHTAIYGDRMLSESTGPKSRSSSTGAALSDEDDHEPPKPAPALDTMTLKSLYISAHADEQADSTTLHNEHSETMANTDGHSTTVPRPSAPPGPEASLPYSPASFRSLFMRYEPPSPFTRWDTPLFTIPSTDAHPPYDQIWDTLFPTPPKNTSKKARMLERHEQERTRKAQSQTQSSSVAQTADEVSTIKQNKVTVLPTAFAPNALQTLESTTGEVTKLVLASARQAGVVDSGEEVAFKILLMVDGENVELEMQKPEGVGLSQPKLQQLRRKYTQIQRGAIAHAQKHTSGRRNVAEDFVQFLQNEWNVEMAS